MGAACVHVLNVDFIWHAGMGVEGISLKLSGLGLTRKPQFHFYPQCLMPKTAPSLKSSLWSHVVIKPVELGQNSHFKIFFHPKFPTFCVRHAAPHQGCSTREPQEPF